MRLLILFDLFLNLNKTLNFKHFFCYEDGAEKAKPAGY